MVDAVRTGVNRALFRLERHYILLRCVHLRCHTASRRFWHFGLSGVDCRTRHADGGSKRGSTLRRLLFCRYGDFRRGRHRACMGKWFSKQLCLKVSFFRISETCDLSFRSLQEEMLTPKIYPDANQFAALWEEEHSCGNAAYAWE